MAARTGIDTLTSDFGARDPHVGAMEGAVCRIFPQARLVDIAHELLALIAGDGWLETAVNGGRAAARLEPAPGRRIQVRLGAGMEREGT